MIIEDSEYINRQYTYIRTDTFLLSLCTYTYQINTFVVTAF